MVTHIFHSTSEHKTQQRQLEPVTINNKRKEMQKGPVMPKMPPLYGWLTQLQGQLRPKRDSRAVGHFVPLPEHPGEPWLGRARPPA